MGKIFLISFDDGTVWDKPLAELLDRYHFKASFNINSGLEDFVWYFGDFAVRRQKLDVPLPHYRNHEIASHSLTHPPLDGLPPEELLHQVRQDCHRLRAVFGMDAIGFAVPFTACSEEQLRLLRPVLRYIRLSEFSDSFAFPRDCYHIPVHALYNQPDIYDRIRAFAADRSENSLFVLCGHAYELEALGQWSQFESLLCHIRSLGFTHMTTMEFVNRYYDQEGRLCL